MRRTWPSVWEPSYREEGKVNPAVLVLNTWMAGKDQVICVSKVG